VQAILDTTDMQHAMDELRLAVAAVPMAMLVADRTGTIVLVNAQMDRMFGYEHGELIGSPIEVLVPEALRRGHSGHRARFFDEPTARRAGEGRELRGLRKDGKEIPIEIGLNPVQTIAGDFVLGSVVDISERQQRERDQSFVMETGELLRTARDADSLALQVIEGLARYLGLSRCAFVRVDEAEDLIRVVAEFRSPDIPALPGDFRLSSRADAVADQRAGRTTVICDTASDGRTSERYQGGYRPFGVGASISVPLHRGGQWIASLAVSDVMPRDWTQREIALVQTVADRVWPWLEHLRLSAEHREREAREVRLFRLAVEAAPTGMILIGQDGRLVLVNSRAQSLFGYSREELIGAPIEMLIPERTRTRHVGFRSSFFTEPSVRRMGAGRDLFGRRKDGTEVPVEVGLTPLRTAEGDFVLSSIVDITERKSAEEVREGLVSQLRTLNAELEERVQARTRELSASLRERDVLLQEVHHRVKNNLQVISSLINMQMTRLEEGKSRHALEECQTRVQAIALIHEKLYQSRDYSRVPFAEYARSLASNVFHATGMAMTRVNLELAIDDVDLAVDRAIPCGLVLNELITNALKHAFKGTRSGNLRVELTRLEGARLRLAVTDDGVGLPDGFDLQASNSLGLRLVSTLSRQLDGDLEVHGRDGASFQLTFSAERAT
jgi:PAS domain S-box-containing protein